MICANMIVQACVRKLFERTYAPLYYVFCIIVLNKSHCTFILHRTNVQWTLTPSVSGQYFIVPSVIEILPNSSHFCQITYKPLTMTQQELHEVKPQYQ